MGWETGKFGRTGWGRGKILPSRTPEPCSSCALGPVQLCAVVLPLWSSFRSVCRQLWWHFAQFRSRFDYSAGWFAFCAAASVSFKSDGINQKQLNWLKDDPSTHPPPLVLPASFFIIIFFFFVTLGNKIKWCGHRKASRLSRFLCRKSRHVTIIALCIALPFLSLDCKSPAPCAMCHGGWTTATNLPLLASWPADCGL